MSHFDAATTAVQAALDAGARYADARVMHRRHESMAAHDGDIEDVTQGEDAGLGVRALVGGSWGFYAVPDVGDAEARAAGTRAAQIAVASGRVPGPAAALVPALPAVGSWSSPCAVDPLGVPLSVKGDMLVAATATMRAHGADVAEGHYAVWDTAKWFVSSEGHRVDQRIRECGAGIAATAVGDGETQHRSSGPQYGTRGWELVTELDLTAHAARVAEEARALLAAPECPAGETTLILGSDQMALQIHESVGHAIELDRILGWEAGFAGTSWLDIDQLGPLRYGSELMNITIDPTIPGALGSFGFDDEGTPAARRDAVRNGRWVGVLAGRDSAAVAGLDYAGSVRADGWARLPMVRMTNVGLEPGPHTLAEMIEATTDGIYMETNRSWSIDDRRLNFQFGCELAYEIKNGRRGRLLRNPTYTGIGPLFWRSMDMLADDVTAWGIPNCGKGQPGQTGHTAHPAAAARFTGVRVGVRG
ncbi:MAG TPA: TldD/PmbA family protein [Pilimelia sp.]|nr:TldD/PmbA family protein [Pilimelia sp.]